MQLQRNTALFLLGVFLLQCFGFQVLLGFQLAEHRSAMRAACKTLQPHHQFVSSELAKARWIHAREFELNGHRYDIVSIKQIDGKTIFEVIADDKEDRLRAQQQLLHKQSDQQNPSAKFTVKKSVDSSPLPLPLALHQLNTPTAIVFAAFHLSGSSMRPAPPDPPPPRYTV